MWDWETFFHYLHSLLPDQGRRDFAGAVGWRDGHRTGCGPLAALMRMSRHRLIRREPASFYVWLFRGTPVLVQLIIIYTGLPQLGIKLGVIPRR